MKKYISHLVVVTIIVIVVFTACDKNNGDNPNNPANIDNPSEINATNVINVFEYDSSINNTVSVKALMSYMNVNPPSLTYNEIVSGIYKDNGFNLTFPETVSDNYLWRVGNSFSANLLSDKDAKVSAITVVASNSTGQQIGYFVLSDISTLEMITENKPMYATTYYYADRNFTMKGNMPINEERSIEYDCSFRKGWNMVYMKQEYSNGIGGASLMTTKKPSNLNFHWYYYTGTLPVF